MKDDNLNVRIDAYLAGKFCDQAGTLRDKFAMQYMDRWLESFFRDGPTLNAVDLDRRLHGMWDDAYANADIAMQAHEPKKETKNETRQV